MKYTIYKRCYPQPDEDYLYENGYEDYGTLKAAKKAAEDMTKKFADKSWAGHPNYKASFYATAVDEEEREYLNHQHTLMKAWSM